MHRIASIALALLLLASTQARAQAPSYVLFESGHVRPLALSPDGSRLFAVNTPDAQLEIFDVQGEDLLVKFRWTPDLRAFPPLPLTRAPQPGDATGFFRLRPAGHTRLLVGRAP